MTDVKETVSVSEALSVLQGRASEQATGVKPPVPILVCRGCGTPLSAVGVSAIPALAVSECCTTHGVSVDANTIKFGADGRVTAAVHLE